jgi:hypothetical protein
MWKTLAAEGNQRRRGVHSVYGEIPIDKVSRYRLTRPAADVEYRRARRQELAESIKPRAFDLDYPTAIGVIAMS